MSPIGKSVLHLEYEAGMPRSWVEPFARLLCSSSPAGYTPERWQGTVGAALMFARVGGNRCRM
jgi:hypothetical protein